MKTREEILLQHAIDAEEAKKTTKLAADFAQAFTKVANLRTFVCTGHKPWHKYEADRNNPICPLCGQAPGSH